MISPEKEVVPMMTPVDPVDKSVEVWMVEVEDMMRLSVISRPCIWRFRSVTSA